MTEVSPSMSALMLNVRKLEGERTELQKEKAQLKRANQDRYHENLRLRSWLAQYEQSAEYARGYADGMVEREAAAANEPVADPLAAVDLMRIVEEAFDFSFGQQPITEQHAALHNAIRPKR